VVQVAAAPTPLRSCVSLHTIAAAHNLSVVAVGLNDSYWVLVSQMLSKWQTRSPISVRPAVNSSSVHTVCGEQARSVEDVGSAASYWVCGSHADIDWQTVSEVAVAAVSSYAVWKSHGRTAVHSRFE
jgi:hypothetical protein